MPTATELLAEAQELTKIAEDLEASVSERVEKFETEIAADRAKVAEAREAASAKIAEAARAMGGSTPTARRRGRPAATSTGGRRPNLDREAIIAFIKGSSGPVGATEVAEHLRGRGFEFSSGTLSNALGALSDEGRINKTGQRRGTRYS